MSSRIARMLDFNDFENAIVTLRHLANYYIVTAVVYDIRELARDCYKMSLSTSVQLLIYVVVFSPSCYNGDNGLIKEGIIQYEKNSLIVNKTIFYVILLCRYIMCI